MKRIFLTLFVLFFSLTIFSTSQATTLSHSTTAVDLNSLTFYTTGTLELSLGGTSISAGTDNSSSSFWKTENEIGVHSVFTLNDLTPFTGETYNWGGLAETNLSYTQQFTARGSGYLGASIDGSWQYDTEDWAAPDASPGGPDSHATFLFLNNDVTEEFAPGGFQDEDFNPGDWGFTFQTDGSLYFTDGQTGSLDIWLLAAAGGLYIDKPVQPVPEPSTVVLFGLGILGLVGFGIKKSKQ